MTGWKRTIQEWFLREAANFMARYETVILRDFLKVEILPHVVFPDRPGSTRPSPNPTAQENRPEEPSPVSRNAAQAEVILAIRLPEERRLKDLAEVLFKNWSRVPLSDRFPLFLSDLDQEEHYASLLASCEQFEEELLRQAREELLRVSEALKKLGKMLDVDVSVSILLPDEPHPTTAGQSSRRWWLAEG